MAGGRLRSDPLYQGLTRPPMIMGVSYLYFMLNMIITLLVFINTRNTLMLLIVGPAVHGIGYLICMKEPRAIELLQIKLGKIMKCRNRIYHGFTNSYDTF